MQLMQFAILSREEHSSVNRTDKRPRSPPAAEESTVNVNNEDANSVKFGRGRSSTPAIALTVCSIVTGGGRHVLHDKGQLYRERTLSVTKTDQVRDKGNVLQKQFCRFMSPTGLSGSTIAHSMYSTATSSKRRINRIKGNFIEREDLSAPRSRQYFHNHQYKLQLRNPEHRASTKTLQYTTTDDTDHRRSPKQIA